VSFGGLIKVLQQADYRVQEAALQALGNCMVDPPVKEAMRKAMLLTQHAAGAGAGVAAAAGEEEEEGEGAAGQGAALMSAGDCVVALVRSGSRAVQEKVRGGRETERRRRGFTAHVCVCVCVCVCVRVRKKEEVFVWMPFGALF
jgi:hypothetical protein